MTELFHMYHNPSVLIKYKSKLQIGTLDQYTPAERMAIPGSFGDLIPYGDPLWCKCFSVFFYWCTQQQ